MGLVSFTMTVKTGCASPNAVGMKPEKKPIVLGMMFWMGTHGFANVDCVTVWF